MKKNDLRGYLIIGIVFIVYSVIAFAVPFSKTSVFWLAYLFAVISVAYQIYIYRITFGGERTVKSKFYGFPIAKIGVVYMAAQLVVSVVQMAVASMLPLWIALICNVIIAAVAIVGCIAADAMRDEIERQDVQIKKNVNNMRELQSLSYSLVGICQDAELKKTMQNLSDEFKYSDPVSSEQTEEMEKEIKNLLDELQRVILDSDLDSVNKLNGMVLTKLKERNRICALSKK